MHVIGVHHHSRSQGWEALPRTKYTYLAIEVFRNLRGEINQRALSAKLGYSFNQVGKWELGTTRIKFQNFLQLCVGLGIPIEAKFRGFFYTFEGPFSEENCLAAIESGLGLSPSESHAYFEKRWKRKASGPDFDDVLELLDRRSSVLVGWLSLFVDCRKIECIQPLFERYETAVRLVREYPIASFVNAALYLSAYQELREHDEDLLMEHACCSRAELREVLELLRATGIVTYSGKKYHPIPNSMSFYLIANASLRGMIKFSTELAASRYSLTPAPVSNVGTVGYTTFRSVALSRKASIEVRELMIQFHSAIREIIERDSDPKENVQVILAHSFPSNSNAPKATTPQPHLGSSEGVHSFPSCPQAPLGSDGPKATV